MRNDELTPIALLSPGWPQEAFPNGIVSYTANLRPALEQLGAVTWVVALNGADEIEDRVVVARQRSSASSLAWRVARRLDPQRALRFLQASRIAAEAQRLVREQGVCAFEMEETGGWARGVASRLSIPVVVRLHGPWFLAGSALGESRDRHFRARDHAERKALEEACWVSSPSRDVLEKCRAHFGLSLPRARVIPNPIRVRSAGERWMAAGAARNQIAFVGRFDRLKGGDVVVNAFDRVLARNPHARLTFIGPDRGVHDDRGRTFNLSAFLREQMGPRAAAVKHFDNCAPDQIHAARRSAWVTVIASRYETHPYAALEAMAMGCPIVASAVGGLREIFEDRKTALLVRPGDPADLARAIHELQEDPKLAERLGRDALEVCRTRFDPAAIARSTLDLYRHARRRGYGAPG